MKPERERASVLTPFVRSAMAVAARRTMPHTFFKSSKLWSEKPLLRTFAGDSGLQLESCTLALKISGRCGHRVLATSKGGNCSSSASSLDEQRRRSRLRPANRVSWVYTLRNTVSCEKRYGFLAQNGGACRARLTTYSRLAASHKL